MNFPWISLGPDQPYCFHLVKRQCGIWVGCHTFGVRRIIIGHLGFMIGFPERAALWIFLISPIAQNMEPWRSVSISFKSSTIRGWYPYPVNKAANSLLSIQPKIVRSLILNPLRWRIGRTAPDSAGSIYLIACHELHPVSSAGRNYHSGENKRGCWPRFCFAITDNTSDN